MLFESGADVLCLISTGKSYMLTFRSTGPILGKEVIFFFELKY